MTKNRRSERGQRNRCVLLHSPAAMIRPSLTSADVSLKATGKHEETRFQPGLYKDKILKSIPGVTYFWKGRYPREDIENFPDSGRISVDQFNDNARDNIFKVTLTAEKVVP